MNTKQQRELAWEAFLEGVNTGGDSSPSDDDYEDIQRSNRIVFDNWWRRRLAARATPSPRKPRRAR